MTNRLRPGVLLAGVVLLSGLQAWGSELRYVPVNPSFGGNPNNASWLQSAANAQNDFKAPEKSAKDKFSDSLQSAIITKLQSAIINGTDGLFNANGDLVMDKSVTIGNFTVKAQKSNDNKLTITTHDNTTGQDTTVVIDYFQ